MNRKIPGPNEFEAQFRESVERSGGAAIKIPGQSSAATAAALMCGACKAKTRGRFTAKGPADLVVSWPTTAGVLIEAKRFQSRSMPLSMVKPHQVKSLRKWASAGCMAGLLVLQVRAPEAAWFLPIHVFDEWGATADRKSVPPEVIERGIRLPVDESIGRTRCYYDVSPLRRAGEQMVMQAIRPAHAPPPVGEEYATGRKDVFLL